MTTTRIFDPLNRLVSIESGAGVSPVAKFRYAYNIVNQRMAVTNASNAYWDYGYDFLGQVTNAVRRWANGNLVNGQQFSYLFDTIGNRQRQTAYQGRVSNFTNSLLNQVTGRTLPGYVSIAGESQAGASVTVNSQTTQREGEYFHAELPVNNSTGAVWMAVTNFSSLTVNNINYLRGATGHVFVAKNAVSFAYDDDGNMLSDDRWDMTWDAENRLTSATTKTAVVALGVPKQKLEFAYDWMGRRIAKTVYDWNSASSLWTQVSSLIYVYDGWNLIAILDASSGTLLASFVWGIDLSGSMQGAGGVGGLLSMTLHTGSEAGTYYYCHDGNGNVTTLVRASDGVVVAEYEYAPFGETLRSTGPLAYLNPFRFSTKYCDDETGLYYYGYRYYSSSTGRWISKDPIGERGGVNLYGMLGNSPLNSFDPHGLNKWTPSPNIETPSDCYQWCKTKSTCKDSKQYDLKEIKFNKVWAYREVLGYGKFRDHFTTLCSCYCPRKCDTCKVGSFATSSTAASKFGDCHEERRLFRQST